MKFDKLELKDLQELRAKAKPGKMKEDVQKAIDNLFLPPKPKKIRRKKDRKRRFSPLY